MHPVQVRGDDEAAQDTLHRVRHAHVAVVEHGGGVEQNLEDQHAHLGSAQHADDEALDAEIEKHLCRMKPCPGRDIHIHVRVVHSVEPPQHGHPMKEPVLDINGEVQHHHGGGDLQPRWPPGEVNESAAVRLREQGETNGPGWRNKTDEQRIQHRHAQIAGPPAQSGNRPSAASGDAFPSAHQREDAEEDAQAEHRLPAQEFIGHCNAEHAQDDFIPADHGQAA